MSSRALPALAGDSGLSRYLAEIRKFPLLAPEEEYMLAKRWKEHEDPQAAHKLVTSHSEIIAEGNVGLMQAVKRFEPERGFRLATYAMWWIRASIQEFILRSWSLVKIGTSTDQKKLFFNLRKAKNKIGAIEEGDLTPEHAATLADQLGVAPAELVNMNRRLSAPDSSLNAPLRSESESEWQDWLPDESLDQETRIAETQEVDERKELLAAALGELPDREREIIIARRLQDDPATLEELSHKHGISRERVRQIEVRAFDRLQRSMKSALRDKRAAMAVLREAGQNQD
jgi:RNA polymerase sigma-32 factor